MRKLILFLLLYASVVVNAQTCPEVPITNQTYTTNTTIGGCTVNLKNVTVDNNATLIVSSKNGITIDGEFNLNAGSVFETGFANITVPTLAPTTPASYISQTGAISGGEVIDDGGLPVTEKGICWSTSENPTINNSHASFGEGGIGIFSVVMMDLTPLTTYWVRAYATNTAGTSYGSPISFTTPQPTASLTQVCYGGGPTGAGIRYTVTLGSAAINTKIFSVTHTNSTNTGSITENITVNIGARTGILDFVYNNQINSYNAVCDFNGPQAGYTITSSQLSFFMAALLPTTATLTQYNIYGGSTFKTIVYTVTSGAAAVGAKNFSVTHTNTTNSGNTTENITVNDGATSGTLSVQYDRQVSLYNAICDFNGTLSGYFNASSQLSYPIDALLKPSLGPTSAVTAITTTTASSGGNVTSDGGSPITGRGICWNTTGNPTIADPKAIVSPGSGTGSFTAGMTGLSSSTTYWIRAYAINAVGTAYGAQVSFTTLAPVIPSLAATTVANLACNSATSGGNVTADGGATVSERGICWGTTQNPTTANSKVTSGSGTGSFTATLSPVWAGTTYYVRSYATNSAGTGYGAQVSYLRTILVPTLAGTTSASNITTNSASSGGNVTSDGCGTLSAEGICWSTTQNPTTANSKASVYPGTGVFTANLTGLSASTTYYVRSYATNTAGTTYGTQISFTTLAPPTVATTSTYTGLGSTMVVNSGNVTTDGGSAITARGICYMSGSGTPTTANSTKTATGTTGTYNCTLPVLTASTLYSFRAYATNLYGTSYGTVYTFTTQPATQTITASTTWTAPTGVTSCGIQCWGGGGAGGPATGIGGKGGGGAGGAYASYSVSCTPGTGYMATVGAGGVASTSAKVNGGTTSFNTIVAAGGAGGAIATTGSSAGGVGTTSGSSGYSVYAGGSGGAGYMTTSGGGGGGAGNTGAGNSGAYSTAGAAKANNGGAGGTGSSTQGAASAGSNYGGGGSGACSTTVAGQKGGNGAPGLIILTFP